MPQPSTLLPTLPNQGGQALPNQERRAICFVSHDDSDVFADSEEELVMQTETTTPQPFPGTCPLTRGEDLALEQVKAMDQYLARLVAHMATERRQRIASIHFEYPASAHVLAAHRSRFRELLALADRRYRPRPVRQELGRTMRFSVVRRQWRLSPGLTVAALCLEPRRRGPVPAAVIVPGVNDLPEDLAGLTDRLLLEEQVARRLAEDGTLVLCPYLVPREHVGRALGEPGDYLDWRRRLWKLTTQVGRTLIGFEVDRVLACLDYLHAHLRVRKDAIVVGGQSQGGLTALYAAAADERWAGAVVVNHFAPREGIWREPVDRAVWGQLVEFGDAEIAALIAPRRLIIVGRPSGAGLADVEAEFARAEEVYRHMGQADALTLEDNSENALICYAQLLGLTEVPVGKALAMQVADGRAVRDDQRAEIESVCLQLVQESAERRQARWSNVDRSSTIAYRQTVEERRQALADMLGLALFAPPNAPLNVETRLIYDRPEFRSYEVLLPVYDGLSLYGVLTVPTGLRPGERRPAIVCQHGAGSHCRYDILGLEPRDGSAAYHAIGSEHAIRGYVTFAPQGHFGHVRASRNQDLPPDLSHLHNCGPAGHTQNIYRKAHSVRATDFGLYVRMHQRAVEWLRSLPIVDGDRIGFHGLSYGGYTALWVAPLVPEYRAVVCAGYLTDWAEKTTTPEHPNCYLWHNDDEMYNFDVLNHFNHGDLAALICPRPFMVETGLDDWVTPKEWVDQEYARVAALYADLGIPERTEIHWGKGGHQIFAERSYPFLDRWLRADSASS